MFIFSFVRQNVIKIQLNIRYKIKKNSELYFGAFMFLIEQFCLEKHSIWK